MSWKQYLCILRCVYVCTYVHSMYFALKNSVTWRVSELQNVLVLEVLLQNIFSENDVFRQNIRFLSGTNKE